MAKKQTRRSISVSRDTYERLKSYCETNQISMSQFVERRVGDYLGRSHGQPQIQAAHDVPSAPARPSSVSVASAAHTAGPSVVVPRPLPAQPLTTPVDSPSPRQPRPASSEPLAKDPDTNLTAEQIFTF